jgi:hypothetical protein
MSRMQALHSETPHYVLPGVLGASSVSYGTLGVFYFRLPAGIDVGPRFEPCERRSGSLGFFL